MATGALSSYGLNRRTAAGTSATAKKKYTPPESPFTTLANVKNTDIAERLSGGLGMFDANTAQNQADISRFSQMFQSQSPQRAQASQYETDTFKRLYGGGLQSDLGQLADQRNLALRSAAGQAAQLARRNYSTGALLGASKSYLNQQALANAGNIYAQAALDNANQRRTDTGYLMDTQLSNIGRQGTAAADALQREMMPYQLRQQDATNAQNQLAFFNAQDKLNTTYGLSRPTQRRTGFGLNYNVNPTWGTPEAGFDFYGDRNYNPNYGTI